MRRKSTNKKRRQNRKSRKRHRIGGKVTQPSQVQRIPLLPWLPARAPYPEQFWRSFVDCLDSRHAEELAPLLHGAIVAHHQQAPLSSFAYNMHDAGRLFPYFVQNFGLSDEGVQNLSAVYDLAVTLDEDSEYDVGVEYFRTVASTLPSATVESLRDHLEDWIIEYHDDTPNFETTMKSPQIFIDFLQNFCDVPVDAASQVKIRRAFGLLRGRPRELTLQVGGQGCNRKTNPRYKTGREYK